MDKSTLISLESHLCNYADIEIIDIPSSIDVLNSGLEGVGSSIVSLLKAIVNVLLSIIIAVKDAIVKISKYIAFKLNIVSTNCRYINDNKHNKKYRDALDKIILNSGISYIDYKKYTSNLNLVINHITSLIASSNIYKQISEIEALSKSDTGSYLAPLQLPITSSTISGMEDMLTKIGLQIVTNNVIDFNETTYIDTCTISNTHTFKSMYKDNVTLRNLSYSVDNIIDIYDNYYTKLYKITNIINNYLSDLNSVRSKISSMIDNNRSKVDTDKVIRLKLLTKNLFICAQMYTTLGSMIMEPISYFTELTTILKNTQPI